MAIDTSLILYSRPARASGAAALGQTHYSYGFAAGYFLDMLAGHGVATREIAGPEGFKSAAYARALGLDGPAHPHLIFRSAEDVRPIAGAYNIACFAWEFDVLSRGGGAEDPVLDDQVFMLGLCDEIWTPSTHAQTVLQAHGLGNVHVVPAPVAKSASDLRADRGACWARLADHVSIPLVSYSSNFVTGYEADLEEDYAGLARAYAKPLGEQPRLSQALETDAPIFLTVCNPYDKRKNLANLIEGFLIASQDRPDAVLVVKLATSGVVEDPAGYLYHQLRLLFGRPHCLDEDRVILIGGRLSDAQMDALYQGADAFLCASLAEGQNLPLIEAMARGCLAVTVANTAMADYVDARDAVVIAERRFEGVAPSLAGDVARRRYAVDHCDRYAIADAILAALALTPTARAALVAAGHAAIDRFTPGTVHALVRARLDAIRTSMAAGPPPSSRHVA